MSDSPTVSHRYLKESPSDALYLRSADIRTPEKFVEFFTNKDYKLGIIVVVFDTMYTIMVLCLTIYIAASRIASLKDGASEAVDVSCATWSYVELKTASDEVIKGNICTKLGEKVYGSNEEQVPLGLKWACIFIFGVYILMQTSDIYIFRSFRRTFKIQNENDYISGLRIFQVLHFSNIVQTVCVVGIGILLIFSASSALEALVDSTAAIFLGETDDCLISALVQFYLRYSNKKHPVEMSVFGVDIECPPQYLQIIPDIKTIKTTLSDSLPDIPKVIGSKGIKAIQVSPCDELNSDSDIDR